MAEVVTDARRSGRRSHPVQQRGLRALHHLVTAAAGLVLGVDMWVHLTTAWSRRRPARPMIAAAAATAIALGVDAYVHLTTASSYTANGGAILNEGNAFVAEAAAAVAAAIYLLARPGRRAVILALAVAVTALAAVLVSTYIDVGAIGPIPNLYEPTWSVPGKVPATAAEAFATATSITGLVLARRPR